MPVAQVSALSNDLKSGAALNPAPYKSVVVPLGKTEH